MPGKYSEMNDQQQKDWRAERGKMIKKSDGGSLGATASHL